MTTRFFVAFMAPPEVDAYAMDVIRELGDRFRTRTAKAPPHITLQPPFERSPDELPALEASLQSFAQRYAPVPLTLEGFGAFAPRVLYINVHKTPELLALQADLMQHFETELGIVDAKHKRRGFSPHMTVASRRMTAAIFREAWADLKTRSVRFEYWGDRLTLLIHQGSGWTVQSSFPLTGSIAPPPS